MITTKVEALIISNFLKSHEAKVVRVTFLPISKTYEINCIDKEGNEHEIESATHAMRAMGY